MPTTGCSTQPHISKIFGRWGLRCSKTPQSVITNLLEAAFSAREPSPRNEVEEQDSIAGPEGTDYLNQIWAAAFG